MNAWDIPYERQSEPRGCGAAALCMVYRSLGLTCSQADVWRRISRPGPWEAPRTNTRLLAADALDCGLHAVILQAREPWALLAACQAHGIRVILNHRASRQSAAGHYSVLVRLDEHEVVVHDPAGRPEHGRGRAEFLELWRPSLFPSEVTGFVLVAITAAPPGPLPCEQCGQPLPAERDCPCCKALVRLHPGQALGCTAADCPARTWQHLFCPHCDWALAG